jgi:hypothetical protein
MGRAADDRSLPVSEDVSEDMAFRAACMYILLDILLHVQYFISVLGCSRTLALWVIEIS